MEIKVNLIPDAVDEEGQPLFSSVEAAIAESIEDKIRAAVDRTAQKIVNERVVKFVESYAAERVAVLVDAVLSGPIPDTSKYGERKGESVTITEIIVEQVRTYLGAKLNYRGEVSYEGKSAIAQIIEKIASEVLTKEVVAQTADIRSKLIMEIATKLAK